MIYFAIAFGILFCAYWTAQLIFVKMHSNWTNRIIESDESDRDVGVSVIHPIKDLDFELTENLKSWMSQSYLGPVQHIFSFQDPDDPAIKVVEELISQNPDKDMTITVNPVTAKLNGKSSNMVNGMKLAKYEMLLFGDSDIRIKPDFIVKMVRPLKDEKVGITTCGQMNSGGRDFWTRFFTFLQNCETDFNWSFLTKIGMDVGMTGAAFGMRKTLLLEIGGLEAYGSSLLEDMHLGNTLYGMGYKIVLGPYLECHVSKLPMEKSLNYAKRIAIGIRTHISFELPAFLLMLFWYWAFLILALVFNNTGVLYLTFGFMGFRVITGLFQRILTGNRIMAVDLIMALFFDIYGSFCLTFYTFYQPDVIWRGITYRIKKGGYIEGVVMDEDEAEATE